MVKFLAARVQDWGSKPRAVSRIRVLVSCNLGHGIKVTSCGVIKARAILAGHLPQVLRVSRHLQQPEGRTFGECKHNYLADCTPCLPVQVIWRHCKAAQRAACL